MFFKTVSNIVTDGTEDNGGQQELPGGAGEVHSVPLQGSAGNHCTAFASTYEIEQCCVEVCDLCLLEQCYVDVCDMCVSVSA